MEDFKNNQRENPTSKTEIWRRYNEETDKTDYFSVCDGDYLTYKRKYKIHWIHSASMKQFDYDARQESLEKAEIELAKLSKSLNRRKLKTEQDIRKACYKLLKSYSVERFFEIFISQTKETRTIKNGKGRAGKNSTFHTEEKTVFSVSWRRKKKEIDAEKNIDGIYPLLSTDTNLSAKEVLQAYKYQPKLEKRFTQLKTIHNVEPLLFKKLERIEANLFIFFIALIIQALIEREVRSKMKVYGLPFLQVYPERRDATHPTTSKIFDIFNEVSTYAIHNEGNILEEYTDELNDVQKTILNFLSISEGQYWKGINKTQT